MCVFCEIASGAQEAHIVHETEHAIAFLDIRPLFPGHTLLIPRAHHETIADLPAAEIEPFFVLVKELARAVPAAVDSPGSFIAINNRVSQSVPHLHVHVVPRRFKDGLKGFFWPRHHYDSTDHILEVAAAIRSGMEGAP